MTENFTSYLTFISPIMYPNCQRTLPFLRLSSVRKPSCTVRFFTYKFIRKDKTQENDDRSEIHQVLCISRSENELFSYGIFFFFTYFFYWPTCPTC